MKLFRKLRELMPAMQNAALAFVSAVLLTFAFPDFEAWPLAFVALVPLFLAIRRESESVGRSFSIGWIFGTAFFFGTCSWLTFAPITYASLPWPPVYFLMLCAAAGAGIFVALFSAAAADVFRRFGAPAIAFFPVVWVFGEFLRMWISGNNWNAIGYSLAFSGSPALALARMGGVYLVGFYVVAINALIFFVISTTASLIRREPGGSTARGILLATAFVVLTGVVVVESTSILRAVRPIDTQSNGTYVVAVQPNVPMDGLTFEKYQRLLKRHVELAEQKLAERTDDRPTLVVFPESPMLFQYGDDEKLREFLRQFAERNKTAVLFNSAEASPDGKQLMNSALMINDTGAKVGQYDKIFLLPFGEFIPFPEPVASWMPAFVGNFKKGNEYDLLPVGDAKAGVMICFESHFGGLSNEYARNGADLLIEMTNDGYLGKTAVLRQHLANSVFRAVETNRPLLRVTNVGVTAYIDRDGTVSDTPEAYAEAARLWTARRSDGSQTNYVRFGDLFAWLCSLLSIALVAAIRFRPDRSG